MDVQYEQAAREIKRLQRCINDLVSLLALPGIWTVSNPSQILHTLLDALMRMLSLDLISVRLNNPVSEAPVEIVRLAEPRGPMPSTHEICEALSGSFADNSRKWPPLLRNVLGEGDVSIVPLPLGLQGELGIIVAATQRTDFPRQTEALLLSVAASQASIGLQEAQLRIQQKHIADELDQQVAQRTAELAAANAELQLQVGLLQHIPVAAWTLKPDGTPDFVNQVWLEYAGQTLEFIRSHPEAWMTSVHPEDREIAERSFWEGVRSGQGFAMETRFLRARDATYRWHLNRAVALRDAEPARGEHNPAAAYGLNFLPVDHPDRVALREAIAGLTPEARQELRALVWVGQGEYAVKEWADAVADAAAGSEDIPADSFLDYPNLHECLTKGLYELRRL